ncbi:surface antigen [Plasmodium falciparum UGT5.1]|uniref:Surface antigen n=1 Tax=Plasmodium falciparum UGT5.1 TaxID=1237627 RepID=W7JL03_PLAFA|nr:surface antigen [Plasmodium falciparum UGT5.1]
MYCYYHPRYIYNQRNHYITLHTPSTKPTKPNRSLCEYELYAPTNYDNDCEMKKIMENFDRVTRRRFEEYNEEKELTEKLSTLQTDISTNDIPTCVCEKSVADKVEKTFFFGCGGILCTAVPGWSIICSIGFYAFLNTNAMEAVVKADIAKVLNELKEITVLDTLFEDKLGSLVTVETYACPNALNQAIMVSKESVCSVAGLQRASCGSTRFFIPSEIVPKVHGATVEGIAVVKDAATKTRNTAFSSPFFFSDIIVISAIVVVYIALILLFIYLFNFTL